MGQGHAFHQVTDISSLCLGGLQEFSSGRNIVKKVPYDKSRSFRCPDFFIFNFFGTFDHISCSCQFLIGLCDQLDLCNCCNARKRLTAEAKGMNTEQIFHTADFTCRMAQKSNRNLLLLDAAPIVCNTDKRDTAFFDFDGHCSRFRVNRIFN